MNQTLLITNNLDLLLQVFFDRSLIFAILFTLLVGVGAIRNSVMDKTSSFREVLYIALFLSVALTIAAPYFMKKVGFYYFLYIMGIGLIQKETLFILKKYVLQRVKKFSGLDNYDEQAEMKAVAKKKEKDVDT